MEKSVAEVAVLPNRTASYRSLLARSGSVARLDIMVASMACLFALRADYMVHVEGRRPHTVNRPLDV
jgi:hypothetical protein